MAAAALQHVLQSGEADKVISYKRQNSDKDPESFQFESIGSRAPGQGPVDTVALRAAEAAESCSDSADMGTGRARPQVFQPIMGELGAKLRGISSKRGSGGEAVPGGRGGSAAGEQSPPGPWSAKGLRPVVGRRGGAGPHETAGKADKAGEPVAPAPGAADHGGDNGKVVGKTKSGAGAQAAQASTRHLIAPAAASSDAGPGGPPPAWLTAVKSKKKVPANVQSTSAGDAAAAPSNSGVPEWKQALLKKKEKKAARDVHPHWNTTPEKVEQVSIKPKLKARAKAELHAPAPRGSAAEKVASNAPSKKVAHRGDGRDEDPPPSPWQGVTLRASPLRTFERVPLTSQAADGDEERKPLVKLRSVRRGGSSGDKAADDAAADGDEERKPLVKLKSVRRGGSNGDKAADDVAADGDEERKHLVKLKSVRRGGSNGDKAADDAAADGDEERKPLVKLRSVRRGGSSGDKAAVEPDEERTSKPLVKLRAAPKDAVDVDWSGNKPAKPTEQHKSVQGPPKTTNEEQKNVVGFHAASRQQVEATIAVRASAALAGGAAAAGASKSTSTTAPAIAVRASIAAAAPPTNKHQAQKMNSHKESSGSGAGTLPGNSKASAGSQSSAVERDLTLQRTSGDPREDPLRDAFTAFFEANEVLPVLEHFDRFKAACVQRVGGEGEAARKFGSLLELLAAAADNSGLSHRMKKVILDLIPVARKRRVDKAKMKNPDLQIVVSGAGPVGLHTALDLYMLGFKNVTVVEKRSTFSRHNILTMWNATAEHMEKAFNCREFFPLFTHREKLPHLGTRELQLTLLKCGLLLGVQFLYGEETVALEAPDRNGMPWTVGLRKPTGRVEPTGVLDLKAGKFDNAVQRAADGAVGMTEKNAFDPTFAVPRGGLPPSAKLEKSLPADVLVLAEGETSPNSKRLGFTKKIQKFSRAIAIVLNLWRDPKDKAQNQVKDFTVQGIFNSPAATKLKEAGIDFEFLEYLRGTTHYVAICVMKKTLLAKKVCREDFQGKRFISAENVSEENLFKLGREIMVCIGLPPTVPFCDFHGAKLFDFGSRSSLPLPFRVLGEATAGSGAGKKILAMDWAAEPKLAHVETCFLEKTIGWLKRTVEERRFGLKFCSDTQKAREETTIQKFEAEIEDLQLQLNEFNADLAEANREKPGKLLPVFPVGDALMEPFWPQGTGTNRGFHTGFDASYCILQYANGDLSQALLSCDFLYRQRTALLNSMDLQPKVEAWTSRPDTRYQGLSGLLQSYTQSDQELGAVKPAAINLDAKTRLACIEDPWPVIKQHVGKPGPLQAFSLTDITPQEDRDKMQVAFKDAIYIPRPTKMFGRSCCPKAIEKRIMKNLKSGLKEILKSDMGP